MLSRIRSFLRSLFNRGRFEADLRDEIECHVAERAAHLVAAGVGETNAWRQARLEFGSFDAYKEDCRHARGLGFVATTAQDLRYAWRGMRRSPGFTTVALASLALGIGANSAVFSLADALLWRSLPVPRPEELRSVEIKAPIPLPQPFSYPVFQRLRAAVPSSTRMSAMSRNGRMTLATDGGASSEAVQVQLVTGEFFDMAEVGAALGRVLKPEDDLDAVKHPVCVISYGAWQRHFAATPDIVGKQIALNRATVTIVGVAPKDFRGVWVGEPTDFWAPAVMQSDFRYFQNYSSSNSDPEKPWITQDRIRWLDILARVQPDSESLLASIASTTLAREINDGNAGLEEAERRQTKVLLRPGGLGFSRSRTRTEGPLFALMAMVAVVLLIACANIANLLLARTEGRQREMAVRLSLGAGRGRLIRQLLTESMLLAFLGGCLSLAVAQWVSGALLRMQANTTNLATPPIDVGVDARVTLFTGALTLITTLLFGLAPALRAVRTGIGESLKSASRSVHGGARVNAAKLLVAGQVGLCLLLLTGAGLFLRSFENLLAIDPGFQSERVLTAFIRPRTVGYTTEQVQSFHDKLLQQIRTLPGVNSASVATCGVASGCRSTTTGFYVEGYQRSPAENMALYENHVSPQFFGTVGMQLLRGRDFTESDGATKGRKVAVVNESMVKRYFHGADPIGRRFGYSSPDTEVIGVVRDARVMELREEPKPMAYYPIRQSAQHAESLMVRTKTDPEPMTGALRTAVGRVDPNVPVHSVTTLSKQVESSLTGERTLARVTGTFGVVALLLACVGLYGVMSYGVVRRTAELGVRLALGAPRSRVVWMILRESLVLAGIGLLFGMPAVFAAGKLLRGILYGIDPVDPATIAAATAILVSVTALAGGIPAWRASRVDPTVALRYE